MQQKIENALILVKQQVERLENQVLDLAQELIRRPSEILPPDNGGEGPAQAFLVEYLRGQGFDCIDVFEPDSVPGITAHQAWWPNQVYTDRPNVVAVRKGEGGGRSLILNGHMDVVPVGDPTRWKRDPFKPEICDGFLYGRGSCDMKSGIAVMVMAVEAIRQAGVKLQGDLILESVVAEETGVYNGTLACCVKGYQADGAVVLEPTQLDLCTGLKGNHVYEVELQGKATHNCLWWRGQSAFDNAIYFKEGMQQFEKMRTEKNRNHPLYCDRNYYPVPALVDDIWYAHVGETHMFAVPDTAKLMFMLEMLPGEDREQVKDDFESFMKSWCSKHPYLRDHMPVFRSPEFRAIYPVAVEDDNILVETMRKSIQETRGENVKIRGFESACDAMTLTLYADTPSIIYGPGNLENAHEIDERVSVSQIKQAVMELADFIVRYCGVN